MWFIVIPFYNTLPSGPALPCFDVSKYLSYIEYLT